MDKIPYKYSENVLDILNVAIEVQIICILLEKRSVYRNSFWSQLISSAARILQEIIMSQTKFLEHQLYTELKTNLILI